MHRLYPSSASCFHACHSAEPLVYAARSLPDSRIVAYRATFVKVAECPRSTGDKTLQKPAPIWVTGIPE